MNYPFCILGLDIGGTKIAGGLCAYTSPDVAPEVRYQQKCASEAKKGRDALVANTLKIARSVIEAARDDGAINDECPLLAVGAGSPGRCEKNKVTVMTETCNFPGYQGTNWNEIFEKEIDLPCVLLNDVQSHTLGEARWGSGAGKQHVVLLAFGTGVGGACVVDGKLMSGTHGYAGELGHFCNHIADGYECSCGKTSHLESVGSGWGIESVYAGRTGSKLTGAEISERAYNGDADAEFCINLAGRAAGCTIAQCQAIFDPEVIIVTGSVAKAGKMWRDALDEGLREELMEELWPNVDIQPALLGDNAPIIGAAECALDRLSHRDRLPVKA